MSWFLDILAIIIILNIGYKGFNNGFIEELGGLLGLVTATLVSLSKSSAIAFQLQRMLKIDEHIVLFFSYIVLFFFVVVLFKILTKFVKIAFLSKRNHLINHILGFTFGILKGTIILISLFWFVSILPLQKWTKIINENSMLISYSNDFRISIISFFNWEDPISLGESYIKNFTQP